MGILAKAVGGITGCRLRKFIHKYKYNCTNANTNVCTQIQVQIQKQIHIILLEFMGIMTKAVGGITGCRRFLPRTELCMADTASCTDTGAWWWWWWWWWCWWCWWSMQLSLWNVCKSGILWWTNKGCYQTNKHCEHNFCIFSSLFFCLSVTNVVTLWCWVEWG